MIEDVNGWNMISSVLKKRRLTQRQLSVELEISPAAISQAKRGVILFNYRQLAQVCAFLKLTKSECGKLFSDVVNARYRLLIQDENKESAVNDYLNFKVHCVWNKRRY